MKRFSPSVWVISLLLAAPIGVSAQGTLTLGQLCNLFLKIKNLFIGVIGTLAVISLLYAAFLFMTASGGEEGPTKARSFFIYGLIGIGIALFAQMAAPSIANFLGISGTDLTPSCGAF